MKRHDFYTQCELENLKILAENPHKNILPFLEYYQDENYLIVVFPYLNGGTLHQYMGAANEQNKFVDLKRMMKQILRGLEFIHNLGIIHRDIKMDNIMVQSDEEVSGLIKIIDFGFSMNKSQSNRLKERCGTIGYLAPEIVNEEKYDERCDVFSLAQVFHILLTQNPMYQRGLENRQIIRMTKNFQFKIDHRKIDCQKARDLLAHMIKEQYQRFTVKNCLSHPYFQKQVVSEKVEALQSLYFRSPFKIQQSSDSSTIN